MNPTGYLHKGALSGEQAVFICNIMGKPSERKGGGEEPGADKQSSGIRTDFKSAYV